MTSKVFQRATGVTSFDAVGLFVPMTDCINTLQKQLEKEKEAMLKVINDDLVPQFPVADIEKATVFLDDVVDAMQGCIDEFKPSALKGMDENKIKILQEKARESARKLVILFGDQSSAFNASKLEGKLLNFQEASQSQDVRARLQSLDSFLEIFGQSAWLGEVVTTSNFNENKKLAIALLKGYPQKVGMSSVGDIVRCYRLPTEMEKLRVIQIEMTNLHRNRDLYYNCRHVDYSKPRALALFSPSELQAMTASHRKRATELNEEKQRLEANIDDLQSRLCQACETQRRTGHFTPGCTCKYDVHCPNPLENIAKAFESEEPLTCLLNMCTQLGQIFEEDHHKKHEIQSLLESKMSQLKSFAEVLNRVPEVLNRYILARLGDIEMGDLSEVKKWISHDEATYVHKMLETFRDEAIYERAVREVTARSSAGSSRPASDAASGKEYLFVNSVGGPSSKTRGEFSEGERDDESHEGSYSEPVSGANTYLASQARSKTSHRQRRRRGKFWNSVAHTPSDMTNRS